MTTTLGSRLVLSLRGSFTQTRLDEDANIALFTTEQSTLPIRDSAEDMGYNERYFETVI